jgi:diguanylate cyclase (GGDEF)-like protein
MKIRDTQKTPRLVQAGRVHAPSPTTPVAPVPLVDKVELAGISGAELTPRVREALMTLMGEVQTLRSELEQARERLDDLEKLADRDPLLDIFNRRAFVRELDRTLAMIDRYGMRASLIFVDLNDLKKINDGKGHGAGDAALAHVAKVLSANVRQTDVVGRLGGDEFGVLLTQADHPIAIRKSQELSALTAAEPVRWNGDDFNVRIACGVADIPKGASADQAMEKADSAMYAVKRAR